MGMFDTVEVSCPRCGKTKEIQSRAGDCSLAHYTTKEVPVEIAKDIENQPFHCDECYLSMTIIILENPKTVKMNVVIKD